MKRLCNALIKKCADKKQHKMNGVIIKELLYMHADMQK